MIDAKEYLKKMSAELDGPIKSYIGNEEPSNLMEATRQYPYRGGKRMRPAMAVACCGAVGGDRSKAFPLAVAVEYIHNFTLVHDDLMDGDESHLKPMVLKDIAAKTGFDISTISRVVNSKYIETHFGIFPLKYFFSEGLENQQGEEVSTRELKKVLQDFVDKEDKHKPLTDDELVTLMNEKGYKVARRTIAKYRDQLNIPKARLRKEL